MSTPASIQLTKRVLDLGGTRLNVLSRRAHNAVPVLFLHGFPTFNGVWREVMRFLPDDFDCHAADLRGFDRSGAPLSGMSFSLLHGVADVVGLARLLSPDRKVVLVGHDIGGMIAYLTAARHPDIVEELIVLNGVHPVAFQHALLTDRKQILASDYLDDLCHPHAASVLAADDFRQLRKAFCRMLNGNEMPEGLEEELLSIWRRPGALEGMLAWYRANRFQRADPNVSAVSTAAPSDAALSERISQPHLLIWGTPDPYLLEVNCRLVDAFCDNLALMKLEDAGHAPHLTCPDKVAQGISHFLSGRVAKPD